MRGRSRPACTGSRCRCRWTGCKAVNVYVIETDDGLTLIDGGWAIEVARDAARDSPCADSARAAGDIRRFLVTHVHRDHYTQAVTVRREFGAHVSLGLGDKPTLDLLHEPGELDATTRTSDLLRAAGAPRPRRAVARRSRRRPRPDLSLWDYPDTWLEGDHPIAVGDRTLDAVAHAGPHPGPLRLRRPGRRAAVRGRPRAADDHAVDRLRAGADGRSRWATSSAR